MIKINNIHASVDGNEILKGISLHVKAGEVHAIMGPNGSGKSTLAKVIAGHPTYEVSSGNINYEINLKSQDLLDKEADERAKEGIFLGFQYPVEIPGVSNFTFLYESHQELCKYHGAEAMNEEDFREFLAEKMQLLQMKQDFLERPVNAGFSGGEKKKNEILQMHVMNPKLALLDETDSGLDIDALKTVAKGVNNLKSKHNAIILVTHYQRLLDYVKPDHVHILSEGRIVKSGDKNLALELEKKGYNWIVQ